MKVIISESFEKKYLNSFKKYFNAEDFARFLIERQQKLIVLQHPYLKLKANINSFAIRGIVFTEIDSHIIPLLLFAKKDKKYGHNITMKTHKELIIRAYNDAIEDIESGCFKSYS